MDSLSHRVPEAPISPNSGDRISRRRPPSLRVVPILQFGLQVKDRLHLGPALTAHGSTTSFGTPSGQRPWRAW